MLFKTIEEVKAFWPVTMSMKFTTISPFIKKAERDFVIPAMSKAEYDLLSAAYNVPTPSLTSAQSALLEKAQEAIALFAYFYWIPSGQVQIGDSGIRIATTDTLKTAFQWQINDLLASNLSLAGTALEDMLAFMEENKADYAAWAASDSYTEYKDCFIPNATEFTKEFSILGNSRMNFLAVRSQMKKVEEFFIKPSLSADFYDELKTQYASNSLTPANVSALKYIKKAIANFTIAESLASLPVIINENGVLKFNNTGSSQVLKQMESAQADAITSLKLQAEKDGRAYLQVLVKFLHENIADYSTYAASSAYDSTTTDNYLQNDSAQEGYVIMM